jgi:RND family efflux transporter MFP subunit
LEPDQLSRDLASLKIDRAPAAGPPRSRTWLIFLVVTALGIAAYFIIAPRVRTALSTPEIELGEVRLVSPSQGDIQLTATGYVVALTSAKVASKVPGRIAELFVDQGAEVKAGDKIARLDDVDFKSSMAASRSRAAAARSKVAIAKAQLTEVKVQIEREKPLVEKGVEAAATLADLQTRSDSLKAGVAAAEAEAQAADAETDALQVQLGSYTIITPISGTVVSKLAQVGEGVAPGFGVPGVVEVVDMSSLVVEVDVPEPRLSQVKIGGPCEVILDAYASKRFLCTVKEIVQRVNRAKATVPVRVRFEQRPETLLPEMAARVSFLANVPDKKSMEEPAKLVIPPEAIVKRAGADVVFVFEDGEVRMTPASAPIPAGTKVVLSPPASLADGSKVKEKK